MGYLPIFSQISKKVLTDWLDVLGHSRLPYVQAFRHERQSAWFDGMEGAFEAMGKGTVDVNWAKEHHSLWLAEMSERERTAPPHAQPSARAGE